VIDKEDL
jgi:hypothetical protein